MEKPVIRMHVTNREEGPFMNFDADGCDFNLPDGTHLLYAVSQGWKTMDSAPRDGTPILACYAPQYVSNGFLPVAVRWRNYHPNAEGKEAFRDHTGAKCEHLTHWMPLPSPPEPPK